MSRFGHFQQYIWKVTSIGILGVPWRLLKAHSTCMTIMSKNSEAGTMILANWRAFYFQQKIQNCKRNIHYLMSK